MHALGTSPTTLRVKIFDISSLASLPPPSPMLAYRHAFHAGNHADVLKHIVLADVLRYMGQKVKPYWMVDTHAGAGSYALDGRYAQTRAEFRNGIARLWKRADLPAPIADYVALVRRFSDENTAVDAIALTRYPGSPAIARMMLRPQDRLRLYELHPTDHRILDASMGGKSGPNRHVEVRCADGFDALKSQLPPPSRRAVVLIDPSYELKSDYGKLVAALRDALARFAECVIVVWYPQLQKLESAQLPARLKSLAVQLAPKGWLHAQLTVQQPEVDGFGLIGSGVFVFNPPWVLYGALAPVMPVLRDALAQYESASFLLERRAV